MTRAGHRLAAATAVVALLACGPITLGTLVGSAWAQSTTTTAPPATTTVPPTTAPTTTTVPPTTAPTTTTTAPRTTTTAHPTTTSSTSSTTTTTTAPASTSSSKTWGWVLLAVVIVVAVVLVALLLARVRRQGREADWDRMVAPSVAAAELARDLVLSQTPEDDEQRRASVAVRVDEAVDGLEQAAATAPEPAHAELCTRCAQSLRGLAFAIEADHLLRSGGQQPTGEQLASADAARRSRSTEFERVLYELKAVIAPKR